MSKIYFESDLAPVEYIGSLNKVISVRNPKKGLEIGFCWGMSAYAFLESCQGTLLSIDLDDNKNKESIFREHYPHRWDILYGRSPQVLVQLGSEKYDWVYIDGDHSYESARDDLEGVLPFLAEGGIICCDDYKRPFGVNRAVDEFSQKYGFKIEQVEGHPNGAVILVK